LLTLLFGLGFAVQLLRADRRGEDARRLYLRRMLVLLLIGVSHATFLWWGDVTWTYAVTGLLLIPFVRRSDRTLLIWAAVLFLVPLLVMRIPEVFRAVMQVMPHPEDRGAFHGEVLSAMRGTDHGALVSAHVSQLVFHISAIAGWYFPWLLAHFLVGFYLGRRRVFDGEGAGHLRGFWIALAIGIALTLAGTAVFLIVGPVGWSELSLPTRLAIVLAGELATVGQTAAYVAIVVLLMQRRLARRALMVLAPVGRMPLSTYLSQSVLASFVFFGWGLGLAGEVGPAGRLATALGLFALQVAIAHLWLRRFRYGPVEWLWRALIYGRAATRAAR
ncbi:MAG TPA: DUF418 domain-containing protein, partial [Kofleriaceae bacterium]|nr:DUF418 domain-containing protein [Kofleriaceae bacterium]